MAVDVAQLRKRVRGEIDQARRGAAERRERARTAVRAYETFIEETAIPAVRQLAGVLRAEGILFDVQTPSGGVRLVADRNRDDMLSIELDDSQDPPVVMLSSTRTWGSRIVRNERPLNERSAIHLLTEDALLDALLAELRPWLA